MRVELMFPGRFLSAADFLVNGPRNVTIAGIYQEDVQSRDGKKEKKWTIELKGYEKKWILCKTNALAIAQLHGPDSKDWPGKRVRLCAEKVQAFGKIVDGIRVKPATNGRDPATAENFSGAVTAGLDAMDSEPDREPGAEG